MANDEEMTGSRILRKEVVVHASVGDAWHAWTTAEGLKFISAQSNVELRIGGPYEWFLDLPADADGKRGGQGARVLAFLPMAMLAFTWTFPPAVPSLRHAGATTQAVVLFDDLRDGTVRVRFAQHGWGEGADWDAGWAYFDAAWNKVLERLKAQLETVAAADAH
jgi:uncharacterized protein YndB with AHSA1/START domain